MSLSALPSDVLPGESTLLVITVTNVGDGTLHSVELTTQLAAALDAAAGSAAAVVESAGGTTVYAARPSDAGPVGGLLSRDPQVLVAAADGIDLAPGDTLRVTVRVTVNGALAPGVGTLDVAASASAEDSTSWAGTSLTVLEEALAFASGPATP